MVGYAPNRRLASSYRRTLEKLGDLVTVHITHVAGEAKSHGPSRTELRYGVDYSENTLELIRSIRPRLAKRFQAATKEDLMTSALFLVARKGERPGD
jgi:hypothetical protein